MDIIKRISILTLFMIFMAGCNEVIPEPIKKEVKISGTVYIDQNANGQRDVGEPAGVGFRIFLDADEDDIFDANEQGTLTDENGNYSFVGLDYERNYKIIQELPFGWRNTGGGGLLTTAQADIEQTSQVAAKYHDVNSLATQVVGGGTALHANYPFLVALQINGQTACTGSLITQGIVLTAAHCVVRFNEVINTSTLQILVGTGDLKNSNILGSGWQRISVRHISVHQDYVSDFSRGNDIAILELAELANQPTLPLVSKARADLVAPATKATVIGWGALGDGSYPNLLQEGNTTITSSGYCQKIPFFADQELCVFQVGGGVAPCFGDSGGPLLVRDISSQGVVWLNAGVVSRGPTEVCGSSESADIYTSVPAFYDWIYNEGREISRSYRILADKTNNGNITNLDFGNVSTLEPFVLEDELAQVDISNLKIGEALTHRQNNPVVISWQISNGNPALICELDAEGDGKIDYQTACPNGEYSYLHSGFTSEDIYAPTLYVWLKDEVRVRSETINVIDLNPGTLKMSETLRGDLRKGDTLFNGQSIDFYLLEPPNSNSDITISLSSTDFNTYLRLFDANTLDLIHYNDNIILDSDSRINFRPIFGMSYLVGVSSVYPAAGKYSLSASYISTSE